MVPIIGPNYGGDRLPLRMARVATLMGLVREVEDLKASDDAQLARALNGMMPLDDLKALVASGSFGQYVKGASPLKPPCALSVLFMLIR